MLRRTPPCANAPWSVAVAADANTDTSSATSAAPTCRNRTADQTSNGQISSTTGDPVAV
jgi:hypothetical protein